MNASSPDFIDLKCIWRFLSKVKIAVLACCVLCSTSACTHIITDPEYFQELAAARTDCTGKEIIGIWVSQLVIDGHAFKETLLIRPDGTGIKRDSSPISETKDISHQRWNYDGSGVWRVESRSYPEQETLESTVRYNGRVLLEDTLIGNAGRTYRVFVPAENDAAVSEYLTKRPSN